MAIDVTCTRCNQTYPVRDALAGTRMKCPGCESLLHVPAAEPVEWISEEPADDGEIVFGDTEKMAQLEAHIERYVGKIETVIHELVSTLVHVDIHCILPTEERPWHTLVTTGMSDMSMTIPEGAGEYAYAELLLCLPPEWPLEREHWDDENRYWPIRLLTNLARYPHHYKTFLAAGHTVGSDGPGQPFAGNNEFSCVLVDTPTLFDEGLSSCYLDDGRLVNFYAVFPLYHEELAHKLRHGSDSLLKKLDRIDATEIIDVHRRNTCDGSWI